MRRGRKAKSHTVRVRESVPSRAPLAVRASRIDVKTGAVKEVLKRGREAVIVSNDSSDPDSHLPDAAYYRSLNESGRDLSSLKHSRGLEIGYYLWQSNPLAKRLVAVGTDHVIGSGVMVHSENDKVDKVLTELWDDPVNNFGLFVYQMADQLSIFGDQCYPVSVQQATGKVRLGYIDPSDIDAIGIEKKTNRRVELVQLKPTVAREDRKLKVIAPDENPTSPTLGKRMGDCFYFRINHVTNQSRGLGDLIPAQDYLDGLDRMIFDRVELNSFLRAFVWDVTLKGASETAIRKFVANHKKPPKFGTVRAHGDNVTWQAVTPNLQASDASEDIKTVTLQAIRGGGAAGMPIHWFGEGENVNKASAVEMGSPAYKGFMRRQAYIKEFLNEICSFAIDQAVIAGTLSESDAEEGFEVRMSEIASRDLVQASTVATGTMAAVTVAVDRRWLSNTTARMIAASVFSGFGKLIDPKEEETLIEQENLQADQDELANEKKRNELLAASMAAGAGSRTDGQGSSNVARI